MSIEETLFADPVPLHEAGLLDAIEAAASTDATSEPLTREDLERARDELRS